MRGLKLNSTARKQTLGWMLAVIVTSSVVYTGMNVGSDEYLSVQPFVSQRFREVPNEQALVDLCTRLGTIQGVTGVSYRDYSFSEKTAVVTVFFDPAETSDQQLRVFLRHSKVLWAPPART